MENVAYENISFETRNDCIVQTATGGHFSFTDPMSSRINIMDIAHSLGNQCRFNGHTREYYSVAEHSILCYYYLEGLKNGKGDKLKLSIHTRLYALMHDAAEAFISDIPAPFKQMFPAIKEKEEEVFEAILNLLELDLGDADKDLVKQADNYMLLKEAKDLLSPGTQFRYLWGQEISNNHDLYKEMMTNEHTEDDIFISCWGPDEATKHFLSIFNDLKWERP